MSTSQSILDDLVFSPVALMPGMPASYGPPIDTTRQIQTPTGRQLALGAPFFARGLSPALLGPSWPIVCSLLRAKSLPVYATVAELESVPVANVPARIAIRSLGQPLVHTEVFTSDAFELANSTAVGGVWGWPYEITSGRDLKSLVQTLREATGGEVPIGMSLPLGAKSADMRACIDSSIDFLTLCHSAENRAATSSQASSLAAHGVLAARKLCAQLGRSALPLMLDAPILDSDHLIKLLALGASAVNIAAAVRAAMPAPEPQRQESRLTESLLGSLPSVPKVVRELPQVERWLSEIIQRLKQTMQFTGLIELTQLESSCLRSLTADTAEQLGIASITTP